jgi:hypothetical protein
MNKCLTLVHSPRSDTPVYEAIRDNPGWLFLRANDFYTEIAWIHAGWPYIDMSGNKNLIQNTNNRQGAGQHIQDRLPGCSRKGDRNEGLQY